MQRHYKTLSLAICVSSLVLFLTTTLTNGQTIVSVRGCEDLIEVSNALTWSDVTAEFDTRVLCEELTTLAVDGGANELTVTMGAQDEDDNNNSGVFTGGGIEFVNVRFEVSSRLTVVPDVTFTSTATAGTQVVDGGALRVNHDAGGVTFEGDATFTDINVDGSGGAWYIAGCDLCVLNASCICPSYTTVTVLGRASFEDCSSSVTGGAVSVGIAGRIDFAGGITANGNTAADSGGAIHSNGFISVSGGKSYFKRNKAAAGGAVYMETLEGYLVPIEGNASLTFEGKVLFRNNGNLDGSDEGNHVYLYVKGDLVFEKYSRFIKGYTGIYNGRGSSTTFESGGLLKKFTGGAIFVFWNTGANDGLTMVEELTFTNNSGGLQGCANIAYLQAAAATICGP